MKLKYYLRGLGIGIVVTALLMGFATKGNNEMSDAEIKARAAELGMVEQRTLADIRDNAEPTEVPMVTEAPTEMPEPTEIPVTTQAPQETAAPVRTEAPQTTEVAATEAPQNPDVQEPMVTDIPEDVVSVQINKGDSSVTVSNALAEAGLIENASVFDRYLCRNGYDKILIIGTYEIAIGTSEEEIARIITNRD